MLERTMKTLKTVLLSGAAVYLAAVGARALAEKGSSSTPVTPTTSGLTIPAESETDAGVKASAGRVESNKAGDGGARCIGGTATAASAANQADCQARAGTWSTDKMPGGASNTRTPQQVTPVVTPTK